MWQGRRGGDLRQFGPSARRRVSASARTHTNAVPHRARRSTLRRRSSSNNHDVSAATKTELAADVAVNRGLLAFKRGEYLEAASLFDSAVRCATNDTETRAGLYNLACCYSKLGKFDDASDCLQRVINEYGLKIDVALEDPDLAAMRETRQFDELQSQLIGGGGSEDMNARLRNEAKNPFRFVRLTVLGGLGVSALIGLVVILARLGSALSRGEEATGISIQETLRNLGINGVAVVVIAILLRIDLDRRNEQLDRLRREDEVGKLLVNLGSGSGGAMRVVPLSRLRASTRPVLVVGPQGYVDDVMKQAEKWKTEFRRRGVVFVPYVRSASSAGGGSATAKGFSAKRLRKELLEQGLVAGESGDGDGMVKQSEKRWKCEPVEADDWEAWTVSMMNVNRDKEKRGDGEAQLSGKANEEYCLYAQLQLDGSVRTSGNSVPPFRQWLDDIPELDDVRTKWTGE